MRKVGAALPPQTIEDRCKQQEEQEKTVSIPPPLRTMLPAQGAIACLHKPRLRRICSFGQKMPRPGIPVLTLR